MEHITKSSHLFQRLFFSKGERKKHDFLVIFLYLYIIYLLLIFCCIPFAPCTENKFTHFLASVASYYTIKYTITFNNIKQSSYLKTIGIFVWQWGRPSIIAICDLYLSTKTLFLSCSMGQQAVDQNAMDCQSSCFLSLQYDLKNVVAFRN